MEQDYDDAYGRGQEDHYCIHGTYVGGWAGPDYMCGPCEDGVSAEDWAESQRYIAKRHARMARNKARCQRLMGLAKGEPEGPRRDRLIEVGMRAFWASRW